MATEIIASGTTSASSADRTIASGVSETLIFRGNPMAGCQCSIEAKGSDSGYYEIGRLGSEGRAQQVTGPLTYRVTRQVGGTASAVDVEA